MDRGPTTDPNKYKITRRGRKLQISDDQRTLMAMPKELPERSWAEILQKEENELVVLEVREELLDEVVKIVYDKYMNRQNSLFTVYCAAEAWLKLIDWFFYRHDPGDDPSAYPPCDIPKRVESWIPDQVPDPSPKDSWGQQNLPVVEEITVERLQKWPSNSSLDMPVIDPIPSDYWFPGKVDLPPRYSDDELSESSYDRRHRYTRKRFDPLNFTDGVCKIASDSTETPPSPDLVAESELLQKVTDYCTGEMSARESAMSALKTTTPVAAASLRGVGDSRHARRKVSVSQKLQPTTSLIARSRMVLAPLRPESRSRISNVSDCRLRSLRLDTQFEISSELMETPPGLTNKRKI